jgi:hypothetical protein
MLPAPRPPIASTVWCVPVGAIGRIAPIYTSLSSVVVWMSDVFSEPGERSQSAVIIGVHTPAAPPAPVLPVAPPPAPDPGPAPVLTPVPAPAPAPPVTDGSSPSPQPARTIAAPTNITHTGAFLIFVPP